MSMTPKKKLITSSSNLSKILDEGGWKQSSKAKTKELLKAIGSKPGKENRIKKQTELQSEFERFFENVKSGDPSNFRLRTIYGEDNLKDRTFVELIFLQRLLAGGTGINSQAITDCKKTPGGRKFLREKEQKQEEIRRRFSEIMIKAAREDNAGVFKIMERIAGTDLLDPLLTKIGPAELPMDDPDTRIIWLAYQEASYARLIKNRGMQKYIRVMSGGLPWSKKERGDHDSPILKDVTAWPSPSISEVMIALKTMREEKGTFTFSINKIKERLRDLKLPIDPKAGRPKASKTKVPIDRGGADPHRKIRQKKS